MKTIKDAVIELGGNWPSKSSLCIYMHRFESEKVWECSSSSFGALYSKEQFESAAKRLGYINGYRWGVEYPTNGKRPDLAEWMIVEIKKDEQVISGHIETLIKQGIFDGCTHFKITDQRYKPDDTSYLYVKQQDHIVEANEMVSDWWDYDKLQVKSGKLIPVGSDVLFFDRAPNHFKCKVMYSSEYVTVIRCIDGSVNKGMIGVDISRCPFEENFNQIKPLDWNRKAEMEREKVIEAANKVLIAEHGVMWGLHKEFFASLYNAGMLVLPQDSSDTKD